MDVDQMKLVFEGKTLKDTDTLASAGILRNNSLQIIKKKVRKVYCALSTHLVPIIYIYYLGVSSPRVDLGGVPRVVLGWIWVAVRCFRYSISVPPFVSSFFGSFFPFLLLSSLCRLSGAQISPLNSLVPQRHQIRQHRLQLQQAPPPTVMAPCRKSQQRMLLCKVPRSSVYSSIGAS